MIFDECVHTDVVIAFCRAMQACLPQQRVEPLFRKCVQQYGEERGHRMAMRALRAGYPLDFNAYQACGEWASTRPELGDSRPGAPVPGMSHSLNYHCLWCETFRRRNAADIGRAYCAEIDRSIVRGFNPDMRFELRSTMHTGDCCDFLFGPYDPEIRLECPVGGVKDFRFHCAHMYHSFCHTLRQCEPLASAVISAAQATLTEWHGPDFLAGMRTYSSEDFSNAD